MMVHEDDMVELIRPVGDWPSGVRGMVVAEAKEGVVIEVAEKFVRGAGEELDDILIQAPRDAVRSLAAAP